MADMFGQSSFNGDLSKWNTGVVMEMNSMFAESSFTGDISKWDVSAVKCWNTNSEAWELWSV
eukprot:129040-Rhodomonas_salina.1